MELVTYIGQLGRKLLEGTQTHYCATISLQGYSPCSKQAKE